MIQRSDMLQFEPMVIGPKVLLSLHREWMRVTEGPDMVIRCVPTRNAPSAMWVDGETERGGLGAGGARD